MKMITQLLVLLVVTAGVTGCAQKEVEETVWDDQIKTMDKAREVEEKLMNRAEQLSRDIGQPTDEEEPPE